MYAYGYLEVGYCHFTLSVFYPVKFCSEITAFQITAIIFHAASPIVVGFLSKLRITKSIKDNKEKIIGSEKSRWIIVVSILIGVTLVVSIIYFYRVCFHDFTALL